jgi:hypothetical protein
MVYGFTYIRRRQKEVKRMFLWVLLFTFPLESAGSKRASGAGA